MDSPSFCVSRSDESVHKFDRSIDGENAKGEEGHPHSKTPKTKQDGPIKVNDTTNNNNLEKSDDDEDDEEPEKRTF